MFPLLLERPPSEEKIEEPEEPEEEVEEEPDENEVAAKEDIRECFEIFDKNKTGTFETRYLDKALKCLGIRLTSDELEEATEIVEKNGAVDFESFQTYALSNIMQTEDFDAVVAAFKVFDPENEGMVSTERFKKWMVTLGNPLTDKEAKDLAKLGDPPNKGIIMYEDLAAIITKR